MAHAFSETALREQEPLVKEHISCLITKLTTKANHHEYIDINDWYTRVSFDIVSDLSFGESLNALQKNTLHEFIKGFFTSCRYYSFFLMAQEYKIFGFILQTLMLLPIIRNAEEMGYQSTKDKVSKRISLQSKSQKDFMTYVSSSPPKSGKLSDIKRFFATTMNEDCRIVR